MAIHLPDWNTGGALCEILNFPLWLRIFDGLDTALEAVDSQDTLTQCLYEVVLQDALMHQTKKLVETHVKGKSI